MELGDACGARVGRERLRKRADDRGAVVLGGDVERDLGGVAVSNQAPNADGAAFARPVRDEGVTAPVHAFPQRPDHKAVDETRVHRPMIRAAYGPSRRRRGPSF